MIRKNNSVGPLKMMLMMLAAMSISMATFAQDASEIIRKMDKKMRGDYSLQEMEMTIVRPTWERKLAFKSWSKGQDYSMILITSPAKEKGQSFLKRQKEMWNWVPSIDRMIKLPPSMMMQSWMGSDFTNDDLVKESSIVNDFTHQVTGSQVVEGYDCYVIELIPKPDAAVVWGKIIMWTGKDNFLQLKTEFFDEDGYLVNTMNLSNVKEIGGRVLPCHWEMIPADEEGNKTIIDLLNADFEKVIPESFFSQQNLKKLR